MLRDELRSLARKLLAFGRGREVALKMMEMADDMEAEVPVSVSEAFAIILQETAREYHVDANLITSKCRAQNVVIARRVVAYFCREPLGLSLPEIGAVLNRDHTSIHFGLVKLYQRREREPEFCSLLLRLRRRIALRLAALETNTEAANGTAANAVNGTN